MNRICILGALMLALVTPCRAQQIDSTRVQLDTMNITFMGPVFKGDTMVTVSNVRRNWNEIRDSIQSLVSDFERYRYRANYMVDSLQSEIDRLKKPAKTKEKICALAMSIASKHVLPFGMP